MKKFIFNFNNLQRKFLILFLSINQFLIPTVFAQQQNISGSVSSINWTSLEQQAPKLYSNLNKQLELLKGRASLAALDTAMADVFSNLVKVIEDKQQAVPRTSDEISNILKLAHRQIVLGDVTAASSKAALALAVSTDRLLSTLDQIIPGEWTSLHQIDEVLINGNIFSNANTLSVGSTSVGYGVFLLCFSPYFLNKTKLIKASSLRSGSLALGLFGVGLMVLSSYTYKGLKEALPERQEYAERIQQIQNSQEFLDAYRAFQSVFPDISLGDFQTLVMHSDSVENADSKLKDFVKTYPQYKKLVDLLETLNKITSAIELNRQPLTELPESSNTKANTSPQLGMVNFVNQTADNLQRAETNLSQMIQNLISNNGDSEVINFLKRQSEHLKVVSESLHAQMDIVEQELKAVSDTYR